MDWGWDTWQNVGEVVHEFGDGTVIELDRKQACRIAWYPAATRSQHVRRGWRVLIVRVRTSCGRIFEFNDKYSALHWGVLWSRTGGTQFLLDGSLIPTNVAILGKPAIATYLSAVHSVPIDSVSDRLGVSEQTVIQYRSDFLSMRR